MRRYLVVCCLLLCLQSIAQKKHRYPPVITNGWYISFNPNSILELEEGGVGFGAGYRFNKKFEVWTEINYLYKGFLKNNDDFGNLSGFRSISSFKYFYKNKHGYFVGIDIRLKHYSFSAKDNFESLQLADTIVDYSYKASHTLLGAGIIWGKHLKLTANGKFEMEGNVGIGVKQRFIRRENIPAGYSKINYRRPDGPPLPDTDIEESMPYFPAVIRFIYHL